MSEITLLIILTFLGSGATVTSVPGTATVTQESIVHKTNILEIKEQGRIKGNDTLEKVYQKLAEQENKTQFGEEIKGNDTSELFQEHARKENVTKIKTEENDVQGENKEGNLQRSEARKKIEGNDIKDGELDEAKKQKEILENHSKEIRYKENMGISRSKPQKGEIIISNERIGESPKRSRENEPLNGMERHNLLKVEMQGGNPQGKGMRRGYHQARDMEGNYPQGGGVPKKQKDSLENHTKGVGNKKNTGVSRNKLQKNGIITSNEDGELHKGSQANKHLGEMERHILQGGNLNGERMWGDYRQKEDKQEAYPQSGESTKQKEIIENHIEGVGYKKNTGISTSKLQKGEIISSNKSGGDSEKESQENKYKSGMERHNMLEVEMQEGYPKGVGMQRGYPQGVNPQIEGMQESYQQVRDMKGGYPYGGGMQGGYHLIGSTPGNYQHGGGIQGTYGLRDYLYGEGMLGGYTQAGGMSGIYPQLGGIRGVYPRAGGMQGAYLLGGGGIHGSYQLRGDLLGAYPPKIGMREVFLQSEETHGGNPLGGGMQGAYLLTGGGIHGGYQQVGGLQGVYPRKNGMQEVLPLAGEMEGGNPQVEYFPQERIFRKEKMQEFPMRMRMEAEDSQRDNVQENLAPERGMPKDNPQGDVPHESGVSQDNAKTGSSQDEGSPKNNAKGGYPKENTLSLNVEYGSQVNPEGHRVHRNHPQAKGTTVNNSVAGVMEGGGNKNEDTSTESFYYEERYAQGHPFVVVDIPDNMVQSIQESGGVLTFLNKVFPVVFS